MIRLGSILFLCSVFSSSAAINTVWKFYVKNNGSTNITAFLYKESNVGAGVGASGAYNWSSTIVPGGTGKVGPDIICYNSGDGANFLMRITTAGVSGFVTNQTPATYQALWNGTTSAEYTWQHLAVPAETNCNHTFLLRNNTSDYQVYYIGTSLNSATNLSWTLAPGQQKQVGVQGYCTNNYKIYSNLYGSDNESDWELPITPEVTEVGDSPTNTVPTVVSKDGPTTYIASATNSPIVFTGTNDTREGYSALYDAITKAAAENNSGLKGIRESIDGLDFGQGGTNVSDSGTHSRLDQIFEGMTNTTARTDFLTEVTNTAAADYTDQNGDLATLLAPFSEGEMDSSIPGGGGDAAWTVELMPGVPFNFRPSRMLGDVFSVAYKFFTWLLLLSFYVKVLHDIFGLVKVAGETNQMRLPNAQMTILGVGGNWGVALLGVYAGVFLVGYASLLAGISLAVGHFGFAGTVGDFFAGPFASVPAAAVNGIAESGLFFPWVTFISLSGAYVVWLATKNMLGAAVVLKVRMMFS